MLISSIGLETELASAIQRLRSFRETPALARVLPTVILRARFNWNSVYQRATLEILNNATQIAKSVVMIAEIGSTFRPNQTPSVANCSITACFTPPLSLAPCYTDNLSCPFP
ncbi:hypothetical protein GCM10010407_06640 [Rarobacter incanus]